jgi:hypothetical protein
MRIWAKQGTITSTRKGELSEFFLATLWMGGLLVVISICLAVFIHFFGARRYLELAGWLTFLVGIFVFCFWFFGFGGGFWWGLIISLVVAGAFNQGIDYLASNVSDELEMEEGDMSARLKNDSSPAKASLNQIERKKGKSPKGYMTVKVSNLAPEKTGTKVQRKTEAKPQQEDSEKKPNSCSSCGQKVTDAGATFCSGCGGPLS